MTLEAQQIAIAESCRWKYEPAENWLHGKITRPNGERYTVSDPGIPLVSLLPDYLNDRNALHEALDMLTDRTSYRLTDWLIHNVPVPDGITNLQFWWMTLPTDKLAEGFLRAIDKWTDE